MVLVATSEEVGRAGIGRHRWAWLMPMWNMCREGFKQLCEKLPGKEPSFEEAWRWTGGSPALLSGLYVAGTLREWYRLWRRRIS